MRWTRWHPFPDPRNGDILHAPFGCGVYDVRRRSTKRGVLFGIGNHVAARMTSLLPKPHGKGTRNNAPKRRYCLRHLADLEYRTLPCATRRGALDIENELRSRGGWVYGT